MGGSDICHTKLLNRNHNSVNQSIALIDCNNFMRHVKEYLIQNL